MVMHIQCYSTLQTSWGSVKASALLVLTVFFSLFHFSCVGGDKHLHYVIPKSIVNLAVSLEISS